MVRQNRRSGPTGQLNNHLTIIILSILILIGIEIFLSQSKVIKYIEAGLIQKILAKTGYSTSQDIPFILIAVDGDFVEAHGCPPYQGTLGQQIARSLHDLGITGLVILDGNTLTIPNDTSKWITYLQPHILYWDAYSKRTLLKLPSPGVGIKPIDALVDLRLIKDENALFMPVSNKLMDMDILDAATWLIKQVKPDIKRPQKGTLIRFLGPPGTVPTLPLSKIVTGNFTPQDVGKRIAVEAITISACDALIKTPVADSGMSLGEWFINAAMTLTQSSVLKFLPVEQAAIVIIIFVILSIYIGRLRKIGHPVKRLIILMFLPILWVAIASIIAFDTGWIPPIIVPAGSFMFVYGSLTFYQLIQIDKTNQNMSARLIQVIERTGRSLEIQKKDADAIIQRLQRVVDFEDVLLFVLPQGKRHLKFLWGYRTDESIVKEKRRDINRRAWLDVIANPLGAMMPEFFKDSDSYDAFGVSIKEFEHIRGVMVLRLHKGFDLSVQQRRYLAAAARFITPLLAEDNNKDMDETAYKEQFASPDTLALVIHEQVLKYKNAIDRLPVGVIVADPLGFIHYINITAKNFVKMAGVLKQITEVYPFLEAVCKNTSYTPDRIMQLCASDEESIVIHWSDKGLNLHRDIRFHGLVIDLPDPTGSTTVSNLLQITIYESAYRTKAPYLDTQGFDMVVGLSGVLSGMKRVAEKENVSLLAVLPSKAQYTKGDPQAFKELLYKLLNTLIHSTKKGSRLEIRIKQNTKGMYIEILRPIQKIKQVNSANDIDVYTEYMDLSGLNEYGWGIEVVQIDNNMEAIRITAPRSEGE